MPNDEEAAVLMFTHNSDGMRPAVAFDADAPGAPAETRLERRRDAVVSRERWQFADRLEGVVSLGKERWMMAALYLSRARLKRDASAAALLPLLLGDGWRQRTVAPPRPSSGLVALCRTGGPAARFPVARNGAARRLLDSLGADPPVDRHALFELDEPKPFAPALAAGDRLGFSLRANPVVRRRDPSRCRSVKHDVVMDALRDRSGAETGGPPSHRDA